MKKYFLNKMSTGKRLAKRSIIGTRVCAPGADGIWYSGTIQGVKTPPSANQKDNTNCINLTPHTRYSVRFDSKQDISRRGLAREFRESELIGPGFKTIMDVRLKPGQKVFLTYNGRESAGEVVQHDDLKDEVTVKIVPVGQEVGELLKKKRSSLSVPRSTRIDLPVNHFTSITREVTLHVDVRIRDIQSIRTERVGHNLYDVLSTHNCLFILLVSISFTTRSSSSRLQAG